MPIERNLAFIHNTPHDVRACLCSLDPMNDVLQNTLIPFRGFASLHAERNKGIHTHTHGMDCVNYEWSSTFSLICMQIK